MTGDTYLKSVAMIVMLIAVAFGGMTVLTPLSVIAESEDVTQISEFDGISTDGVEDDFVVSGKSAPGIILTDGGWGECSLTEFSEVVVTASYYLYDQADVFYVRLSGEGGNVVTVTLQAMNADMFDVSISDHSSAHSQGWDFEYPGDCLENWNLVVITIYTDDSGVHLTVQPGPGLGRTFDLFPSSSYSGGRAWDSVRFSASDESTVTIDDIRIVTNEGGAWAPDPLLVLLMLLFIGSFVAMARTTRDRTISSGRGE